MFRLRAKVTFVPPICDPRFPDETESDDPTAIDDVATFANVLAPEK